MIKALKVLVMISLLTLPSCGFMTEIIFGLPEPESCQKARATYEEMELIQDKLNSDPPLKGVERIDLESRLENLRKRYSELNDECDERYEL